MVASTRLKKSHFFPFFFLHATGPMQSKSLLTVKLMRWKFKEEVVGPWTAPFTDLLGPLFLSASNVVWMSG